MSNLTVAENYVLGQGSPLRPLKGMTEVAARIIELSRHYGLEVKPDAFVRDLSVGERQRVEILKILYLGVELLVLDEPTAVLTPGETNRLLEVLRALVRDGKTVIFISHKLDEVMRVSDRSASCGTARSSSRRPPTRPTPANSPAKWWGAMSDGVPPTRRGPGEGRFFRREPALPKRPRAAGGAGRLLRGSPAGDRRRRGVSGNGQSELAFALTGLIPATEGSIKLNGEEIRGLSSHAINQSLCRTFLRIAFAMDSCRRCR